MATDRGSQHKLVGIKEVSYGTTPATPVMLEIPKTSFTLTDHQNAIRSAQLRSHPFVDRLLKGMFTHDVSLDWELQNTPAHDMLLEVVAGAPFVANALNVADAIQGLSLESQFLGNSLFDQAAGCYLARLDFAVGSGDTAPIKMTASGMAKIASLKQGATIATSVTAAPSVDPFIFTDATVTVNGVATPITSANFSLVRTVDAQNLIGLRVTDEYIPADVALTGTIVVPLRSASQASLFTNFSDCPIVINTANPAGTSTRTFTIPKTKLNQNASPVTGRGAILQTFNFEAFLDTVSGTVLQFART